MGMQIGGPGHLGQRKVGSAISFFFSVTDENGARFNVGGGSGKVTSVRLSDFDLKQFDPIGAGVSGETGSHSAIVATNLDSSHWSAPDTFGLFSGADFEVNSIVTSGLFLASFELVATTDGEVIQALPTTLTAIGAKTTLIPAVPARSLKKNTAANNIPAVMTSTTTRQPTAGLTVSCSVSKDGGAFAGSANAVVEVGLGLYKVNATAGELNADQVLLLFTAPGAEPREVFILTTP